MRTLLRVPLLFVLFCALVVGACGGGESDAPGPNVTPPPGVEPAKALGPLERELRLVSLPGFAPPVAREGFGCDVSVDTVRSADELVRRVSSGDYDGALGNGDALVRLLTAGEIAPVNTKLVPGYEDVYEGLKEQPFNSVGGQMFGLPAGRSSHVMVYRRNTVPGSLASLGAVLDPPQVASLGEQITVPDDPAAIAEAALYVARQRKDLEITDPYELDRRQFNAVLEILRLQEPYVRRYWTDPQTVLSDFRTGRTTVAIAPQSVAAALEAVPGSAGPVASVRPREGATGASPAWMVMADAKHPNCMYAWLDRTLEPEVSARVALDTETAPAASAACEQIPAHCEDFRADDESFYGKVLYRTTPSADCGDERGRVCMDWEEWVKAWDELRSGS